MCMFIYVWIEHLGFVKHIVFLINNYLHVLFRKVIISNNLVDFKEQSSIKSMSFYKCK